MKIRSDIVQVYREVHSWVGILCGLFLFVAFYAGSISMFEAPLQNWLTPAPSLPAPVSLEDTPDLLQKAFSAVPDARSHYTIVLKPDHAHPARLMWPQDPTHRGHGPQDFVLAALSSNGELVTVTRRPSEIPFFIDQLHEQVGLPLPHFAARYVMGCVATVYFLALVSGVIAFLPALKKMLFAVRLDTGARKVWLDLHNLLGFFSLPFHCVIALTAVVFAFHDPIYTVQSKLFAQEQAKGHGPSRMHGQFGGGEKSGGHQPLPDMADQLPPTALLAALQQQAPGFVADTLEYTMQRGKGKGQTTLRISGHDDRYPMRGATNGFAVVDSASGKVQSADYLPGHQSAGFAAFTAFFALHFGSYGGLPVRWGYYCLGLGGAFMFYAGNRLWILARLRREHANGPLGQQTRGTWFLSCLTSGCIAGCMTGIALLFICGPFLPSGGYYSVATAIYYAAFLLCVGLAFVLGERVREPLLFSVAGFANIAVAPAVIFGLPSGQGQLPALCVAAIVCLLGFFLLWSVRRSACKITA